MAVYHSFGVAIGGEGLPEVLCFFILPSTEELMDSALVCSVLTTAILWARGRWDEKSKYLSVCVGFQ